MAELSQLTKANMLRRYVMLHRGSLLLSNWGRNVRALTTYKQVIAPVVVNIERALHNVSIMPVLKID